MRPLRLAWHMTCDVPLRGWELKSESQQHRCTVHSHVFLNNFWLQSARQESEAMGGSYVGGDLHLAGLSLTWWKNSQDRAGWRAALYT